MKSCLAMLMLTVAPLLVAAGPTNSPSEKPAARSEWVYPGPSGRLEYRQTTNGTRIMDFSSAGYGGGGVAFPKPRIFRTIEPSGGDDTAAISDALTALAAQPLDQQGLRGAVKLAPGVFSVQKTLRIAASGMVLIGSGTTGATRTVLSAAGDPRLILNIEGKGKLIPVGSRKRITSAWLPAGSMAIPLEDTQGLTPGDNILVENFRGASWVKDMGMDALEREGKPLSWLKPSYQVWKRRVSAINGSTVTLDAALPDFISQEYAEGNTNFVTKYEFPGSITQCGLAHLVVKARFIPGDITTKTFRGMTIADAEDCFVDDVQFFDCGGGTAIIWGGARRITLRNIEFSRSAEQAGGAGGSADLTIRGSQVLVLGGKSYTHCFIVVTQPLTYGPNVVCQFTGVGTGSIQPHTRWATGLLVDDCTLAGGVEFINRGIMGWGHGWAIGNALIWNTAAEHYWFEKPPLSEVWCIGSTGTQASFTNELKFSVAAPGIYDCHGTNVVPRSLYLAQLKDRLGEQAVKNALEP